MKNDTRRTDRFQTVTLTAPSPHSATVCIYHIFLTDLDAGVKYLSA
jgi:hypothetical protein